MRGDSPWSGLLRALFAIAMMCTSAKLFGQGPLFAKRQFWVLG
jgi:hypothetical protein